MPKEKKVSSSSRPTAPSAPATAAGDDASRNGVPPPLQLSMRYKRPPRIASVQRRMWMYMQYRKTVDRTMEIAEEVSPASTPAHELHVLQEESLHAHSANSTPHSTIGRKFKEKLRKGSKKPKAEWRVYSCRSPIARKTSLGSQEARLGLVIPPGTVKIVGIDGEKGEMHCGERGWCQEVYPIPLAHRPPRYLKHEVARYSDYEWEVGNVSDSSTDTSEEENGPQRLFWSNGRSEMPGSRLVGFAAQTELEVESGDGEEDTAGEGNKYKEEQPKKEKNGLYKLLRLIKKSPPQETTAMDERDPVPLNSPRNTLTQVESLARNPRNSRKKRTSTRTSMSSDPPPLPPRKSSRRAKIYEPTEGRRVAPEGGASHLTGLFLKPNITSTRVTALPTVATFPSVPTSQRRKDSVQGNVQSPSLGPDISNHTLLDHTHLSLNGSSSFFDDLRDHPLAHGIASALSSGGEIGPRDDLYMEIKRRVAIINQVAADEAEKEIRKQRLRRHSNDSESDEEVPAETSSLRKNSTRPSKLRKNPSARVASGRKSSEEPNSKLWIAEEVEASRPVSRRNFPKEIIRTSREIEFDDGRRESLLRRSVDGILPMGGDGSGKLKKRSSVVTA